MDFYIHTCQGCCYPSLFLCCPKTWTPGILLPACPGHVPLQQAYRDRHGDIRVVGVLYCRQATTWQIKQQYILIGREGLWPPAASNSTELTFFPLLILVRVVRYCHCYCCYRGVRIDWDRIDWDRIDWGWIDWNRGKKDRSRLDWSTLNWKVSVV